MEKTKSYRAKEEILNISDNKYVKELHSLTPEEMELFINDQPIMSNPELEDKFAELYDGLWETLMDPILNVFERIYQKPWTTTPIIVQSFAEDASKIIITWYGIDMVESEIEKSRFSPSAIAKKLIKDIVDDKEYRRLIKEDNNRYMEAHKND